MPTNKKVKCKECGKRFEALSPRASLCPECKKKKAAARRSKRQQKGKSSLAQVVTQVNSISNQNELASLFPPEIWEQIPVDIDTFLFDRRYLGNAWLNGRDEKTMFPFWEKLAHQVYPLPMRSPYNTIILSGSTGCVDCDTEFFDGYGWKKISEWKQGDKVLQWSKDGTAELVTPIAYIKKKAKRLYELKTKYSIDATLSGDHRFVYISSKGNLCEAPFEKVVKRYNQSKKGVSDKVITSFRYLGGKGVSLSDNEIRLMVAVIADGHFPNLNNRCCINIKKQYKKDRLVHLLSSLNLPYERKEYPKGFSRFYFFSPRREKVYSKFWYDCSRSQLEILAEELPLWDSDKEPKRNRLSRCRTKVKETADFIQFVYSSLGYRTTICSSSREGKKYIRGNRVYERRGISYKINPTRRNTPGLRNPHEPEEIKEVETKDGYQYCFSVPSSYLVLRKNDKIFITGNCGKTSFSMGVLLAYYLHIVLCLRNPHEYFDLADQKNIIFAVINIVTKSIAYKNAWGIINKMLIRSPWFMERGISTEGRRPEWICTTKPVELIYGRNEDDLIGLDILFCFMDEVSFARNQSVERQIEIATEVFNVAWERMKSRFLKFGGIYEGLMVMASSKRTDVSFLEGFTKKILEDSDSRKVLVVDKARWEVLPPSSYSGKIFPLAVGDKFKPSQIIKEDEVDLYKKNGYNIMWSPEEYRSDFERDMQKALTNIAGISVGQISSFLRGELVQRCINPNNQNLFIESVIFSDYRENDQYYERIDLTRCRPTDFTLPLFIHVDASLGRDGNSISGVLVDYYTNTMTELGVQFDLHYRQLFKIKVRAPKNGQTGLAKNRQFIFWLRQQGFNIQGVSFDQYQSFETLQILEKAGFNVKKQSIDKVDSSGVNQPYEALKNALYENRIELLDDEDQTDELVSLERYENGKIDKPIGGHDDAAQCLAGALFLASQCKEELLYSGAILLKALDYTNSPGPERPPEEKIQEEITRHFASYSPDQARVVNQRSSLRETYDDVFGLNENKNKNKKGVQNNPTVYWG